MTMSYPLCVFLESREQGMLSTDHPFYELVHGALQDVIKCQLILNYMTKTTLGNGPPNKIAESRRAKKIIEYLQNDCPTVSGSDSPTMDSSLVETRMYSGCGNGPKDRKIARQHVYIQKCLVDAWLNAYISMDCRGTTKWGQYLLLTSLMRICLLRGFITAVKLAFAPDINMKDRAQSSPALAHGSPCSFEHFLWKWDCWVTFWDIQKGRPRYDKSLSAIVFSDRDSFCHACITGDMQSGTNSKALRRFAAGDWTAFPPAVNDVYQVIHPRCIRVWDSPPADDQDHKPRRIETTAWSTAQEGIKNKFNMYPYSHGRWITVCRRWNIL